MTFVTMVMVRAFRARIGSNFQDGGFSNKNVEISRLLTYLLCFTFCIVPCSFKKMKTLAQGKHDIGGWSAKFGAETRKQRHPCELTEAINN